MVQRGSILFLTLFCSFVQADISVSTQLGATAEVVNGRPNATLGVQPTVLATLENKTASFNSTTSATLETSKLVEIQPLQWQSANQFSSRLFIPSLTANTAYTHQETISLLSGYKSVANAYQVGLISTINNGPLQSNVLQSAYSYSEVDTTISEESSSSDSQNVNIGYTHSRLLKSTAMLAFNVSYTDYLNEVRTINASANLSKPLKVGLLTLNAGFSQSYLVGSDSNAMTGAGIYTYTSPKQSVFVFSVSKQRTDYSTLLLTENFQTEFEASQLVDTTSGTAGVNFSNLDGRLRTSLGYQYSIIQAVSSIEGVANTSEPQVEIDAGYLNVSYALSKQSKIAVNSQFSFLEQNVTLLGDLEYQKEIAKNVQFKAGIGSNDLGNGIERYFASLSYRFGRAL